jgi:hypothetical protein
METGTLSATTTTAGNIARSPDSMIQSAHALLIVWANIAVVQK